MDGGGSAMDRGGQCPRQISEALTASSLEPAPILALSLALSLAMDGVRLRAPQECVRAHLVLQHGHLP